MQLKPYLQISNLLSILFKNFSFLIKIDYRRKDFIILIDDGNFLPLEVPEQHNPCRVVHRRGRMSSEKSLKARSVEKKYLVKQSIFSTPSCRTSNGVYVKNISKIFFAVEFSE